MPADGMFAAYRIDQDFSTCRRQMLHETAEVRELAHGPNGKWSTSALTVAQVQSRRTPNRSNRSFVTRLRQSGGRCGGGATAISILHRMPAGPFDSLQAGANVLYRYCWVGVLREVVEARSTGHLGSLDCCLPPRHLCLSHRTDR